MKRINHSLICGVLIALCFTLIFSGYISWLYKLSNFLSAKYLDFIGEAFGYLFQAVGLAVFAFAAKKIHIFTQKRNIFILCLILDLISIALVGFSQSVDTVIVFGFIANILHGIVFGYCLLTLTVTVPQQYRGVTFGGAFGVSCIVTYHLSLLFHGDFFRSNLALIFYFIFVCLIVRLLYVYGEKELKTERTKPVNINKSLIILAAIVILLLSSVESFGFNFPILTKSNSIADLQFSRAFYAMGLIIAGIVADRSRKYGAICCLAGLVSLFISIAFFRESGFLLIMWILAYIFFGFLAVYRVLVFSDIAGESDSLLYFSAFGLLFGRVGDSVGAFGGMVMQENYTLAIAVAALLFIVFVFLFFKMYHLLYMPQIQQEQDAMEMINQFEARHHFTARECEVFQLILNGESNLEIAGDLHVSESTVKFHVRNILKKTGCENRISIIACYKANK